MNIVTVLIASTVTALCTGIGAIPLFFIKDVSKRILGIGNAAAAGLMLGASIGLIVEGAEYGLVRLGVGIFLGLILIVFARSWMDGRDEIDFGEIQGADARKILLILGVMTVHSFAEGIGVGVAFGDGNTFGSFITTAIAIHNIPEGLAISLILVPRGVSVMKAAGWSIFSSLPQPIMAILAFLFVLVFQPFLPIGLGLAAGAMIWMVFTELIPDAKEDISSEWAVTSMGLSMVSMLAFQQWIS